METPRMAVEEDERSWEQTGLVLEIPANISTGTVK
jgi:hypothetical protein